MKFSNLNTSQLPNYCCKSVRKFPSTLPLLVLILQVATKCIQPCSRNYKTSLAPIYKHAQEINSYNQKINVWKQL